MIELDDFQKDAISKMHRGCILCGGVGSGKSRTSLAYYYELNGGDVRTPKYSKMKNPTDLYIITTARKRDTKEWEEEFPQFHLGEGLYDHKIVIDSWNNIQKYVDARDAFFIFDEQRLVGSGAWVEAFYKIAKSNHWVLLSATPGDTWSDYIPVFVANGFFADRTSFEKKHVVWKPFVKYRAVERYLGEDRLRAMRRALLVDIRVERKTVRHSEDVWVLYDHETYQKIWKDRWNVFTNAPIKNSSELCFCLRHLVNSDLSRQEAVIDLVEKHPKSIIFYNYDFELLILRDLPYGKDISVAEWNGKVHEPIPATDKWVYLVQYTSGCEGWNCTETDTIIFYSQNYSYRIMTQAAGRIDRRNTGFTDLYYYNIKSRAAIDLAISRSLNGKKKFNESAFCGAFKGETT